MWLTNSSIGRKLIMSITGACLVLFLTFHCLMNAVAIFWPAAYNVVCAFLGANWYALVASIGLAVLFIIHIIYALWLTLQNRKARGNDRYNVVRKPLGVEWSSQNMLVLGVVILAFLVLHLIQFWAKMQLAEIRHTFSIVEGVTAAPAAGTLFLQQVFCQPWVVVCYAIGFIALWFHLTHGFWSMFQTCGWNNDIWIKRVKCIGNWWTTIIVGLFLVEAVVFTAMAMCDKQPYLNCPALQEQYKEFENEFVSEGGAPCCAVEGEVVEMESVVVEDCAGCPNAAECDAAPCASTECDKACQEGVCPKESCDNANCPKGK